MEPVKNGRVEGKNYLNHAKRWDVYNLEKEVLIKDGYSVGVTDKDSKKVILEVVDDHVIEEGVEHEDIGIEGFGFNLFDEDMERCVGDYVKEFPYLIMFIKLWPRYWEEQIYQMNKKMDEENGRGGTKEDGIFEKLRRFSRKQIWRTIGCHISAPTFSLGGSRLWEKDQNIRG